MAATTARDNRVTPLLQEAAEWRLLGRLFECPSREWRDDLERLGHDVPDGPLRVAAQRARASASEGLYHSVFGPGGPAPPREASYHASVELGSLLSEIEGDYEAFAYHPEIDEPPDHIAVETGFIAYLRLKEAFAHASADEDAAGIAARTAERFITAHLAPVAHPLATLLAMSGIDYLASASSILAARSGPAPTRLELPVIQPDAKEDDGGEFACDL